MIKNSPGRKIFLLFDTIILSFIVIITLYPMLYVLFASLSSPRQIVQHKGFLFGPVGLSTIGYELLIKDPMIIKSFLNSVFILVSGVIVNIVVTTIGAYFLSRKKVYWKKLAFFLIIFTMYFSGGLIPLYLTIMNLHIFDTYWALILPGAINTVNLIIMRTAFLGIPDSVEESARIDGAGHLRIIINMIIPLSLPTIAVMVLYYGVGHWNSWFNAMIFLQNRSLYPLQLILREKLILSQVEISGVAVDYGDQAMIGETLKYAVIIFSSLPMLCLYPFIQKYFVKGVMIGSIKG